MLIISLDKRKEKFYHIGIKYRKETTDIIYKGANHDELLTKNIINCGKDATLNSRRNYYESTT